MQDPQSLHKYAYVHGEPVNATDPTGLFALGSAMAGSTIGSMLNQTTGQACQMVMESLHERRFAWESAGISVFLSTLPILGMAVGKVFGSQFFRTSAGKLLAKADDYLTAITGFARGSAEILGRRLTTVPAATEALSNVRSVLLAMQARFGGDVKVVAQLHIDGSMWTGINNWAKEGAKPGIRTGDRTARVIANELGVVRQSTGNVPFGPFLNHAEGHTLIQAVADGTSNTSGKSGRLFVSEIPCGMCQNNFSGMKEILKLDSLEVWYLDALGNPELFRRF